MRSTPSLASILALPCLVVVLGSLPACRDTKPPAFGPAAEVATGGRSGTGGRPSTRGTGGATAAPAPAPAPAPGTDAKPATDAVASDAVSDVVSSEVGDGPVASEAPVEAGPVSDAIPDVVTPVDGGGMFKSPAACHPNSRVIAICAQLEPACNNCAGGGIGTPVTQACYAAVQRGNDTACAKFAVDRKCTVDPGGNVCGSLNCGVGNGPPVAAGCNRTACRTAQGNGDTAMCQRFLATCPCK